MVLLREHARGEVGGTRVADGADGGQRLFELTGLVAEREGGRQPADGTEREPGAHLAHDPVDVAERLAGVLLHPLQRLADGERLAEAQVVGE